MTTRRPVEVGQRFRSARADYGTSPTQWEIVSIYLPWQGSFEHARLRSTDKRTETMTLAVSVMADKNRFVRID